VGAVPTQNASRVERKRGIPVESLERHRMLEESDPITATANDPAPSLLPIGAGNSACVTTPSF